MFNVLDDEMKRDDRTTTRDRWLRYGLVALLSIVLFGSLYAGVQFLD